MTWLWLAVGGVAGAQCRFHGVRMIQARWRRPFPLGTLLINVSGSCLLGLLFALLAQRPTWPLPQLRLLFGTGFCGAYTTFSSFGWETVQLWRAGRHASAIGNLVGQPLLGLAAVWIGMLLGTYLG